MNKKAFIFWLRPFNNYLKWHRFREGFDELPEKESIEEVAAKVFKLLIFVKVADAWSTTGSALSGIHTRI
ncbi:MAG: hypothetical protein OEQ53_07000 [Saprospiraceae bacterium]|nr:hypothetical protein [Saprospiraceae bacterium]